MSISKEAVIDALSNVMDPDLGKDLVTLNMVKDVAVSGSKVTFTVVLTTPACPMKEQIKNACVNAIVHLVDPNAEVEVNMTANVTSKRSDPGSILPDVLNTIAVASGKGGVGKSTVAANLAVALARSGARVGLVDVDIYGPSVPTMFGLKDGRPFVNEEKKIVPLEKYGVKLLSMGFLVDQDEAVVWRGPMVTRAVRQFLEDSDWGELDYLILDLPPGTGDIQLTIVQTVPLTGAIVVSTPQDVALADARKGVAMFEKVNVPVLGIVENMAFFIPPDDPSKKYYIFGKDGATLLARKLGITVLGKIPIEEETRVAADEGEPIVIRNPESSSAKAFVAVAEAAAQQVAIRNADLPPTEKIVITR